MLTSAGMAAVYAEPADALPRWRTDRRRAGMLRTSTKCSSPQRQRLFVVIPELGWLFALVFLSTLAPLVLVHHRSREAMTSNFAYARSRDVRQHPAADRRSRCVRPARAKTELSALSPEVEGLLSDGAGRKSVHSRRNHR